MNIKDWYLGILQNNKRSAVPIMTHPGIDLSGKKVIDAVCDGQIHAHAIEVLSKEYPSDAATIIMDLTVEAEAFGSKINFQQDEVPSISERIVYDEQSVKNLIVPQVGTARTKEYLEATRLSVQNIKDKPIIGGCIGPFSLAGRLFNMTEIMTALYLEPETITVLVEKCSAFLMEYVKEFKKTGAHGIVMAEPAAGLLSEDICEMFSSLFVRKIVEEVQDDNFMFILHNCGNTGHVTQSMISTGARGLHFGNKIDLVQTLKEVPSDVLVMGNLDPVSAFKMANPQEFTKIVEDILIQTKPYKNFVLSSGCDVPPGVSKANIDAFYNALKAYNKSL